MLLPLPDRPTNAMVSPGLTAKLIFLRTSVFSSPSLLLRCSSGSYEKETSLNSSFPSTLSRFRAPTSGSAFSSNRLKISSAAANPFWIVEFTSDNCRIGFASNPPAVMNAMMLPLPSIESTKVGSSTNHTRHANAIETTNWITGVAIDWVTTIFID